MRICKVQIDNYRNLKHVDVDLGNIVTVIGENNGGKSNFLRAIAIPLSKEDNDVFSKRLTWYDINNSAKKQYYQFLKEHRSEIVNGTITESEFCNIIPKVTIVLYFKPSEKEHYDIKDILVDVENCIGGVQYSFSVNKPSDLLSRVKTILASEEDNENVKMSLLPIDLYTYSVTIPGRDSKISYETLTKFRCVAMPAERDSFASSANKIGSRSLSDLLQKSVTTNSQMKIEKAYSDFFDIVKREGKFDEVLNWQGYSDIPNAQDFFQHISILPDMPQMRSVIRNVRLGYEEEDMFLQGLGHRNLILMAVLLNSYINKERDLSFRLMAVEEPEAHLCISNIMLMISLIKIFSKKNEYTQIVYSTHNAEFVNKIGLENTIIFHNGSVYALNKELTKNERDYISSNPNTDIFKLLYSRKLVLVEGVTEELLIKSYLQTRNDLNDIKILSFHKGFSKIIDIWKKINVGSDNKLGIVRDYDNQPNAQNEHEKRETRNIIVRTTKGYTLETDIVSINYEVLKSNYGKEYDWDSLTACDLQNDWRNNKKKSDVMLRICQDLTNGNLNDFKLPPHIQEIIDFMQEDCNES